MSDRINNNSPDLCDKATKQVVKNTNIYPGRSGDVGHRYSEGHLALVTHIRLRGVQNEERNFCATFYGSGTQPIDVGATTRQWRDEVDLPAHSMVEYEIEHPVLVRIVEFTKDTEEGRKVLVRSIVRLRALDSCLRIRAQSGDSTPLLLKCAGTFRNGKLERPEPLGSSASGLSDRQCVNEVIERGPEIMDTVASDEGPSVEGRVLTDFDSNAVAAKLSQIL